MANIVIAFFQSTSIENGITCFYDAFIKELQKANNVFLLPITFNWNSDLNIELSPKIIRAIIEFNPDLYINFNNIFFDFSQWINCPTLIYGVDTPMFYSNKNILKERADSYKHILPCSASVHALKSIAPVSDKDIAVLPFFTAIEAKPCEQDINISFVGNNFSHSLLNNTPFTQFMETLPNKEEINQFKECISYLKENPLIDFEAYKSHNKHLSEKILDNISEDLIWYFSASDRIKTLSQVADLGLELYGPSTWGTQIPSEHELNLCYNSQQVLSLLENETLYNRSKIGININHNQASNAFSWRVCDIMASNACLVTQEQKILKERFPNINLPTFTSRYEARELCEKLLKNKNMREDIVLASHEIIDKKYRFKHILPQIEELVNVKLS